MLKTSRIIAISGLAISLAAMLFASPAVAAEGKLTHVETGLEPEAGTHLDLVGYSTFWNTETAGIECTMTARITMNNGSAGEMTEFAPAANPPECKTWGDFLHCTVTQVTEVNAPYSVALTTEAFEVTGIAVDLELSGFLCPDLEVTTETIAFNALEEGERPVWGTEGNLGNTTEPGDPIAGFEWAGEEVVHDSFGGENTLANGFTGALELTEPNRSEWVLVEA